MDSFWREHKIQTVISHLVIEVTKNGKIKLLEENPPQLPSNLAEITSAIEKKSSPVLVYDPEDNAS